MQAKVPMDIGIEDQIIGPISFRQLIILLVGIGLAYAIYKSMPSEVVVIFLVVPIVLLTLAFAFLKVNEMPFAKFVLSLFSFISTPNTRIWIQRDGWISQTDIENEDQKLEEYKRIKQEILFKSKIETLQYIPQLTEVLNRKGFVNPEILENAKNIEQMEDEEYFHKIYRDESYDFNEHIDRVNKLLTVQKQELIQKKRELDLEGKHVETNKNKDKLMNMLNNINNRFLNK